MRLPFWKRKPMIAEAVAETSLVSQESDRNDVFLRLMQQFEPALRRLAAAYFDREADRADLFQEIALALWQAIPRFRRESSERTWLYRIAHNVAISSSARTHRRARREEFLSEEFEHPSAAAGAEEGLLLGEKRRALVDSIRLLAATDRQIILLHLEGLSYAEIEEVSGLSETAIATRLSRIRAKLKEEIRKREVGKP
jgi:RNA polymerase sigma factor (sigma-70 family)